MRLPRVVVRLPENDKKALDRLRDRYFDETKRGLSRAAVMRILVRRILAGADALKASEVLGEPEVTASSLRESPPRARAARTEGGS